MAKVYASLILKGIKTLSEVPETLRAAVEALLSGENGGDVNV